MFGARSAWSIRAGTIGLSLLLTACGGTDRAPPARPTGSRPATLNLPTARETQACYADLSRADVRYSALPDRDYGGGCSLVGAVQLIDIGVPVTGIKGMRCGVARSFTAWTRFALAPAAKQILGSELVRVETFGSYACRNTIGTAAAYTRLSGHASGNAIDFSGVVLADGRRISVQTGWRSPDADVRRFFEVIHASACKRFGTVLSPDYNAAHYNHLHLEDDRAGFCR
ncbi:MAG: extensin family protein [Sphingomonas sp.]|nr:extensin family protein [Sphingomonas sp.]